MKFIDKIKIGASILKNSLFYAMKGADSVISTQANGEDGQDISKHIERGGVFEDFTKGVESQQVKEARDISYRVFLEADKYKVGYDNDGNLTVSRKTLADFAKHSVVFEEKEHPLKVIQTNNHIAKKGAYDTIPAGLHFDPYDYETTLTINRVFTPRFKVEKFVNTIVLKHYSDTEDIVELYVSIYSKQFDSLSALMVNECRKIYEDKEYNTDTLKFDSIEFITDKAWGSESLCEYKYDNLRFEGATIFDGHFVFRFIGHKVNDGTSVVSKFKTKEVDELYASNVQHSDVMHFSAAAAAMSRDNNSDFIEYINNENSN